MLASTRTEPAAGARPHEPRTRRQKQAHIIKGISRSINHIIEHARQDSKHTQLMDKVGATHWLYYHAKAHAQVHVRWSGSSVTD